MPLSLSLPSLSQPRRVKVGFALLCYVSATLLFLLPNNKINSPASFNEEYDSIARRVSGETTEMKIQPTQTKPQDANVQKKPMMYTFYEKVSQGEDELLQVWRSEWERIGFETHILTMKDALAHPLYEAMKEVVQPIFHETYNALCFYRWLAMASTDGGWMSDYDTFPTNFPIEEGTNLPRDGTLTSFESHVPSLISGTKEEWNRTVKLMIEALPRTEGFPSDMMVFRTIREDRNSGIHFLDPSRHMQKGFKYSSKRKVDCEQMQIGRAVHLSHKRSRDAVDAGLFPVDIGEGVDEATHRAQASKVFLEDFRSQCVYQIDPSVEARVD